MTPVAPRSSPPARKSIWVESNHEKEAARALEMLHVQLLSAVIDPYSWKWAIMATHHAVRAFATASLEGASPAQEAGPPGPGHWLEARQVTGSGGALAPADCLFELFERTKRVTGYSAPPGVDEGVARIVEAHSVLFRSLPIAWRMRVDELPVTVRSCLTAVEHLGWNPGYIGWQRQDLTDLAKVKHLASLRVLEALDNQYKN